MLKRAVLEEQNKTGGLRESVRSKEIDLRRVEQEVESLSFRNKQLEHRVASLQEDLSKDAAKKGSKGSKSKSNSDPSPLGPSSSELDCTLLSEELQKKIIECAQLTSMVADKTTEMSLQSFRIDELEQLIRSTSADRTSKEDALRKQIERLECKNRELEAKVAEAGSIVGSDDTLYVSECDQYRNDVASSVESSESGNARSKMDERLRQLEQESAHWRSQYEVLQLFLENGGKTECSPINLDINAAQEPDKAHSGIELLKRHYAKKMYDIFTEKCVAESKLAVYMGECDSLQRHLCIADCKLREQERKFAQSERNLQITDEDLVRIRAFKRNRKI